MAEFKREERYIVIKLKDQEEGNSAYEIKDFLRSQGVAICANDCVVVESDWPIYEQTWDAVQRLAEGRPQRAEELEAERDALARRLNDEDVSHANTIEQRDYAENMADKLSTAIAGITGEDIGEHSSAHCPWTAALEQAEEYESERDALVAHVERLNEKLKDIRGALYGQGFMTTGWHLNGNLEPMDSWFEDSDWEPEPLTRGNLTRLIAKNQAEAVIEFVERAVPRLDPQHPEPLTEEDHPVEYMLWVERERIHAEAEKLRQQAEGGPDE